MYSCAPYREEKEMFLGHFAVGLAAKRYAPRASLGALIAAPLLLDLLWPVFLLTGWEQVRIEPGNTAFTPLAFIHYPWTHSLLTAFGWAILYALLYFALTKYRQGAVCIFIGVFSHWFLDAVVHRRDLPLFPGSETLVGLGLWNWPAATIIIESVLFIAGVWLYRSATRASDKIGRYAFWAFVGFLVLVFIGNALGPPPADTFTLTIAALSVWLLVLWAWWFDRHRTTT
jgi:membrane-bound metal-dependent hydrolase YbcI (DUF457 family)